MTTALLMLAISGLLALSACLWWRMNAAHAALEAFQERFGFLDDQPEPRVRLNRPRRSADR